MANFSASLISRWIRLGNSLAELAAVTRALNELQAAFDLDYGVDMRQLADAAIKELEEQYPDYQIATHLKEVPAVACHQEQLYQLLLGIMSNSLAALEQMAGVSSFRGRLRVTLGPSERHGEQGAALLVSDNANDVSLEAREAFYEGQSADGLAGMGLSVAFAGFSNVRGLAKEIGGHFQVDADNGILMNSGYLHSPISRPTRYLISNRKSGLMLLYRTVDDGVDVEVHRLIPRPSSGVTVFCIRLIHPLTRLRVMSGTAWPCHRFWCRTALTPSF